MTTSTPPITGSVRSVPSRRDPRWSTVLRALLPATPTPPANRRPAPIDPAARGERFINSPERLVLGTLR